MPYPLSLQEYTRPEFYAEPPAEWERRLREISPITPNLSHLGFRKFEPREDWKESEFNLQPDRPMWAIYTRTPRVRVHPDKVEQLRLHWSELPTDQQAGRKALVSDYQHFMWHTTGYLVQPLLLLQGPSGGTPALYSERQKAWLRASGAETTPFAPGMFTPCVFDQRSVDACLKLDRLLEASNNFDALEKMDRPEAKKAEDEAAEMLYRETYLDTLSVLMAPAVEFMKSNIGKTQVSEALPPAPKGLANTLATWKDVFKETGRMPGIGIAPHKKVFATS